MTTKPSLITQFIEIPEEWAYGVGDDGSIIISKDEDDDIVAVFPPDPALWLPALAAALAAITPDAGETGSFLRRRAQERRPFGVDAETQS